ncbi:hypothetical protein [Nocardia sp. NPDC050435]|uniref:hypothetical protein n=1 Tax=Nocardia sp. NPDC050435 TaxID=3155040 RepID=UPI0033CF9871
MALQFGWPMAVGDTVYSDLPQALSDTARIHARRALDLLGSTGPLDLLDQATSIGVAAELMLKAILASVDIALLRAKQSDSQTALTLAGRPLDPTLTLPDMKTVGAGEALDALTKMAKAWGLPAWKLLKPTLLTEPVRVRDSAVHMGFAREEANELAVAELVRFIDIMTQLQSELGQQGDWASFWTDEYLERADEILRLRKVRILSAFQQAIVVAKKTFAARWTLPTAADTIRIIEQVDSFPRVEHDQTSRHHRCPACGSLGWVLYDIERGAVQVDTSDSPHSVAYFVEQTAIPTAFHCAVCDLLLEDEEDLSLAAVHQLDLGETDATDAEVDRVFGGTDDDRWDDDRWEDR